MKLTILGSSGGISSENSTTSFLLGEDLLIDAGTGIGRLSLKEMRSIRTILLTHSHLDHVCYLPFLLNNTIADFEEPVEVFGLPETIDALQKHIFNDVIWPDFTKIPNAIRPALKLCTFEIGDTLNLSGLEIHVLPAEHTVPAVGFRVSSAEGSFAFTGDCAENNGFWESLNQYPPVDVLIVDDQYLCSEVDISEAAKHYYPESLRKDLMKLASHPKLYLTHLPPYKKEKVMTEAKTILSSWQPESLDEGKVIQFPIR